MSSTFDRAMSMSDPHNVSAVYTDNDNWFEDNQGNLNVYATNTKIIIGLSIGLAIVVISCTFTCLFRLIAIVIFFEVLIY